MGIAHIAVDLRLRNKRRYRVHDHDIDSTGAHHCFRDLQRLLAVIRLGDIEVIDINADIFRVYRIKCVLRVDKSSDTAAFLYFRYHMESDRRLTTGLRPVDLYNTSLRDSAEAESDIKAQRTGRNRLDIHICAGISEFHNGTFSVSFFDLCESRIKGF